MVYFIMKKIKLLVLSFISVSLGIGMALFTFGFLLSEDNLTNATVIIEDDLIKEELIFKENFGAVKDFNKKVELPKSKRMPFNVQEVYSTVINEGDIQILQVMYIGTKGESFRISAFSDMVELNNEPEIITIEDDKLNEKYTIELVIENYELVDGSKVEYIFNGSAQIFKWNDEKREVGYILEIFYDESVIDFATLNKDIKLKSFKPKWDKKDISSIMNDIVK